MRQRGGGALDMHLLVLVSSRIGDTLLVTPSIRALRKSFPEACLEVRAHPRRLDLLRQNPNIDRLGAITPRRARFMGWLSQSRVDTALVYNPDPELNSYAQRVANRVVSFGTSGGGRASADRFIRVPRPSAPIHAVRERLMLPEAIGATASGFALDYVVDPVEQSLARQWVSRHGGHQRGPLIGVQLQSFPTKAHRDWPAGNFVMLLEKIRARFIGSRFVLIGDESGRARAAEVARELGECCVVAAGGLTLRESAAVIAELDLYIGVDTGPTHIAGALGVPMVALYHCFYPGRNLAPIGHSRCRVIEHPATYAGCSDLSSMEEISVDAVWTQVKQLLDERE